MYTVMTKSTYFPTRRHGSALRSEGARRVATKKRNTTSCTKYKGEVQCEVQCAVQCEVQYELWCQVSTGKKNIHIRGLCTHAYVRSAELNSTCSNSQLLHIYTFTCGLSLTCDMVLGSATAAATTASTATADSTRPV